MNAAAVPYQNSTVTTQPTALRPNMDMAAGPYSNSAAVATQPTAIPPPSATAADLLDCPPGLEPLAAMDALFVVEILEALEVFIGIEAPNRYAVLDSNGQRIFFAAEVTHPFVVWCGGTGRPFMIQLMDLFGEPILTVIRDCSCGLACCGCTSCGGNEVVVTHIDGEILGTASQQCSCCTPDFEIKNGSGRVAFRVRGPSGSDCCTGCVMGACCTAKFPILLPDEVTVVGVVHKMADLRQFVSDANTFGVRFNFPLTPKEKALILAAVFVIDFGYFEGQCCSVSAH